MEQLALVGDFSELPQVSLKGIRRVEVMRRLQQSKPAIAKKPAQGRLQKRTYRHMVAVKDGDEVAAQMRKCMINVSGLRVCIVVARDVLNAGLLREFPKLISPPIIEQQHAQLIRRIIERRGGKHCALYNVQRLVVRGDEDIHGGPFRRISFQRKGRTLQRAEGLEISEDQRYECEEFRSQKEQDKCSVPSVDVACTVDTLPGLDHAPIAVPQCAENRYGDQKYSDCEGTRDDVQKHCDPDQDRSEDGLLFPG